MNKACRPLFVKLTPLLIVLSLLAVGCNRRDAEFHKEIIGTWMAQESSPMIFLADGSFHVENTGASSNTTSKWPAHGTWDVKRGVFILSITNGAPGKPLTNFVWCSKIKVVDRHKLVCEDEKGGCSWFR
jgi:hypothetical protein